MTDEPNSPQPERPETGAPADTSGVDSSEATGVIDVGATQQVGPVGDRERGWFDDLADKAPGVPPRADAPLAPAAPPERAEAQPLQADDVEGGALPSTGPGIPAPMAAPGPSHAYGSYAPPTAPAAASESPSPMAAVDYPVAVPGTGSPAPRRRRRRRVGLVAAVLALCLVSGFLGAMASQLLVDRINLSGAELPQPGPGATARPSGSVANIAATALPSVVTIKVGGDGQEGTGSGFVIDAKGHILTNNHVVAGAADGAEIEVVLSNGDTERATIVGRDGGYDLAVLKIRRTDLQALVLGESDKVVVGDQVIAVGAPLGLEQTVTTGIVSALNRPVSPGAGDEASYMNAIQTDAAINPGNSGGPLLDMSGQVIGVNSAIARVPGTSGATGGNIGLGFAIPSDQARRTAEQLITTGKATHPVIGVMLDRTFNGEGAQVVDERDAVTPGGPAAKAGIKPGDVIIAFEGKRVRTPDALIVAIRARAVGDTVTLTVERDGKEIDLKMVLEADPKG